MGIAQQQVVKGGTGTASTSSATVSTASTLAGSTILVIAVSRTTTFATTPITDSNGNTYTSVLSLASTTGVVSRAVVYVLGNAGAGIVSVTASKSAADTRGLSMTVIELTGCAPSPVDVVVSAVASVNGTAVSTGTSSASIAVPNEAVIGFAAANGGNPPFSAQTFGGTAATYSGQTDNGTETDGTSSLQESLDTEFVLLSGSTLGTISYAATISTAGWVAGAVSFKPLVVPARPLILSRAVARATL